MRNIFSQVLFPAMDTFFMSDSRKSKIAVAMDAAIAFGMLEALENPGIDKAHIERTYQNKVHRLSNWNDGGRVAPNYVP